MLLTPPGSFDLSAQERVCGLSKGKCKRLGWVKDPRERFDRACGQLTTQTIGAVCRQWAHMCLEEDVGLPEEEGMWWAERAYAGLPEEWARQLDSEATQG